MIDFDDVWQKGEPPKHGYYLAAWRSGTLTIVSELWFNPDASPKWWTSRGYIDGYKSGYPLDYAMRHEVISWRPIPDPPKEF